jgi:hypothetical protein
MYSKATLPKGLLDPPTAQNLADVMFEIGKDLIGSKDFKMATKWLSRAHEVISTQELDRLSRDAVELRLSICQGLVHALLRVQSPEAKNKAENLLSELESQIGDKPIVLLLRLDSIEQAPPEEFDAQAYAAILRRMIWTFDLSEANFKLLKHYSRKLYDKSPQLGAGVLEEFLTGKILSSRQMSWIEQLVISVLWMATSGPGEQLTSSDSTAHLHSLFTDVQENLGEKLSSRAAVVAQTVSLAPNLQYEMCLTLKPVDLEEDHVGLLTKSVCRCRGLVPSGPS